PPANPATPQEVIVSVTGMTLDGNDFYLTCLEPGSPSIVALWALSFDGKYTRLTELQGAYNPRSPVRLAGKTALIANVADNGLLVPKILVHPDGGTSEQHDLEAIDALFAEVGPLAVGAGNRLFFAARHVLQGVEPWVFEL